MEQYKFTKKEIKQLKRWIEALESGEYPQTAGRLQNEHGYCCLGVGCKLFIDDNDLVKSPAGYISGALPTDQKHAPDWLKMVSTDFYKRGNYGDSIVSLNDFEGKTFKGIAARLRDAYKEELNQLENE